jgi:hypothetical protein
MMNCEVMLVLARGASMLREGHQPAAGSHPSVVIIIVPHPGTLALAAALNNGPIVLAGDLANFGDASTARGLLLAPVFADVADENSALLAWSVGRRAVRTVSYPASGRPCRHPPARPQAAPIQGAAETVHHD